MTEKATVVKTDKTGAVVRLDKRAECDKCGLCAFPKNAGSIEMHAFNNAGANAGDEVIVERSEKGRFLGAILVFLVPLLLIGAASVIALLAIKQEIWVLFLSIIFLVAWFSVLALIDKKLGRIKGFAPVIIKVEQKYIAPAENEKDLVAAESNEKENEK